MRDTAHSWIAKRYLAEHRADPYINGDTAAQFAQEVIDLTELVGLLGAQVEKAQLGLEMVAGNEHGESYSAGVAVSALAAIEEAGLGSPIN